VCVRTSEGLSETGYVECRNVIIEYRWADGQNEHRRTVKSNLTFPKEYQRLANFFVYCIVSIS
jgi:hypothetical protein